MNIKIKVFHAPSNKLVKAFYVFGLDISRLILVLVGVSVENEQMSKIQQIFVVVAKSVDEMMVTITVGGISRQDVNSSLAGKQPVIVLEGTGRPADELAKTTFRNSHKMMLILAENVSALLETI